MTLTTLLILQALLDADPSQEMYGLEIRKATGLATGTLYPILARLEGGGWVTSTWETLDQRDAGRPRRRYYRLTDGGREAAESALSSARALLGAMKEKQ
jgi:PadR family transcriptional regulator